MRHRLPSFVAVLSVASLVLAGCGSGDDGGGDGGAAGGDINIGLIESCSGIYAITCDPMTDGVEYWLETHDNEMAGRKVNFTKADDKSTTEGAIAAANSLIRQHEVDAIVGLVNSASALAVRPTLTRSKIITMATVASSGELLDQEEGPYLFMVTQPGEATAAASAVLAKQQGLDNFVGIADDYIGARGWVDPSLESIEELGLTVKGSEYPAFPTSDYGPYISKLAELDPDTISPVMFGPSASTFFNAYNSFGLDTQVYTTGSMFEPAGVSQELLAAAEGSYAYWAYSPFIESDLNKSFVDGFKAKYDRYPGAQEFQNYTAMDLLEAAYEKAGDDADADDVRTALQEVTIESAVGPLTLGSEQAVSWNLYMTKIEKTEDGEFAMVPTGPYIKGTNTEMTVADAEAAADTLP